MTALSLLDAAASTRHRFPMNTPPERIHVVPPAVRGNVVPPALRRVMEVHR
jgi:hypothetical protein